MVLKNHVKMITANLLIIVCGILVSIQAVSFLPSNRKIQFDRFDGMSRGKDVPIRTSYKIFKQGSSVFYFNATTTVSEDLEGTPLMHITLVRCKSRENLDTCEDFMKPAPTSFCKAIDPRILSPFAANYEPEFKCPFKKGIYNAYNQKGDLSPLVIFPLGNWYWRGLIEVKDEKTERLLCTTYADLKLVKA